MSLVGISLSPVTVPQSLWLVAEPSCWLVAKASNRPGRGFMLHTCLMPTSRRNKQTVVCPQGCDHGIVVKEIPQFGP